MTWRSTVLRFLIAGSASFSLAASAEAWSGEVEKFVASLNTPHTQQEMGLKEVRRPEDVANRLDVVFQDGVPAERRSEVLQHIGQKFLMHLFETPGITTVTVVERDARGFALNRAVVSLGGLGSVPDPRTDDPPAPMTGGAD